MNSIFKYLILCTVLLTCCIYGPLYGQSFPIHRNIQAPSNETKRAPFRSPPKVLWITDIQHANQLAQQSQRPLFMHFIQDDCPACLQAEIYTFQDSRLIDTLHTQFIPVQINLSDNPMLRRRFNIKNTPTDIILGTDGTELLRRKTDLNPLNFASILTSITTASINEITISDGFEFNPTVLPEETTPRRRNTVVAASFPLAPYPAVAPTPPPSKKPSMPNPTTRTVHGPEPPQRTPHLPSESQLQVPQVLIPGKTNRIALGLDGYCPVSLTNLGGNGASWIKGNPNIGIKHRGRLYLFTGPLQLQLFLTNPDKFSPVLSGYDPVLYADYRRLIDGQRRYGVSYRQRIYLFQNAETLKAFWQAPDRYAQIAQQAMANTR
ncbi:MAG: hypothetical protein VX738_15110 [Planctomycetota bacterium]|nr:hypothetical protein [Planctomycetota bacterium]